MKYLIIALLLSACAPAIEGPPRIVIHQEDEGNEPLCFRDFSQSDFIDNHMEGSDSALSCERGYTRLDGWCEIQPDLHAAKPGMFINISGAIGTNGWECNATGTGRLVVHLTCSCE